jgi:hypothetical protein
MKGEKASTCKKSITGLVGYGTAPRCVSGIKIPKNEKAMSESREANNVFHIVTTVLRQVP